MANQQHERNLRAKKLPAGSTAGATFNRELVTGSGVLWVLRYQRRRSREERSRPRRWPKRKGGRKSKAESAGGNCSVKKVRRGTSRSVHIIWCARMYTDASHHTLAAGRVPHTARIFACAGASTTLTSRPHTERDIEQASRPPRHAICERFRFCLHKHVYIDKLAAGWLRPPRNLSVGVFSGATLSGGVEPRKRGWSSLGCSLSLFPPAAAEEHHAHSGSVSYW